MRENLLKYKKYDEIIDMIYISNEGKISQRKIKIIEVSHESFRAYCFLRKSTRTFCINNILALVPLVHKERMVLYMVRNKHLQQQGDWKDRGRIKWTAMMLPEHVRELRGWYGEDQLMPDPELTEFDRQLIGEEIERALSSHSEVKIKTWADGVESEYCSKIEKIDPGLKCIVLEQPSGTRIYFEEITNIELLE